MIKCKYCDYPHGAHGEGCSELKNLRLYKKSEILLEFNSILRESYIICKQLLIFETESKDPRVLYIENMIGRCDEIIIIYSRSNNIAPVKARDILNLEYKSREMKACQTTKT